MILNVDNAVEKAICYYPETVVRKKEAEFDLSKALVVTVEVCSDSNPIGYFVRQLDKENSNFISLSSVEELCKKGYIVGSKYDYEHNRISFSDEYNPIHRDVSFYNSLIEFSMTNKTVLDNTLVKYNKIRKIEVTRYNKIKSVTLYNEIKEHEITVPIRQLAKLTNDLYYDTEIADYRSCYQNSWLIKSSSQEEFDYLINKRGVAPVHQFGKLLYRITINENTDIEAIEIAFKGRVEILRTNDTCIDYFDTDDYISDYFSFCLENIADSFSYEIKAMKMIKMVAIIQMGCKTNYMYIYTDGDKYYLSDYTIRTNKQYENADFSGMRAVYTDIDWIYVNREYNVEKGINKYTITIDKEKREYALKGRSNLDDAVVASKLKYDNYFKEVRINFKESIKEMSKVLDNITSSDENTDAVKKKNNKKVNPNIKLVTKVSIGKGNKLNSLHFVYRGEKYYVDTMNLTTISECVLNEEKNFILKGNRVKVNRWIWTKYHGKNSRVSRRKYDENSSFQYFVAFDHDIELELLLDLLGNDVEVEVNSDLLPHTRLKHDEEMTKYVNYLSGELKSSEFNIDRDTKLEILSDVNVFKADGSIDMPYFLVKDETNSNPYFISAKIIQNKMYADAKKDDVKESLLVGDWLTVLTKRVGREYKITTIIDENKRELAKSDRIKNGTVKEVKEFLLKELEAELSSETRELTEKAKDIVKETNELTEVANKTAKLTANNVNIVHEISENTKDIVKEAEENKHIESNEAEDIELLEKGAKLAKELVRLAKENKELAELNKELAENNKKLAKDNLDLINKNINISGDNGRLTSEKLNLSSENNELKKKNAELQSVIDKTTVNNEGLIEDNKIELANELESLADEISHIKKMLSIIEKNIKRKEIGEDNDFESVYSALYVTKSALGNLSDNRIKELISRLK